jgi:hypothetical protein
MESSQATNPRVFFGRLKDESDILFHFGFEGCSGAAHFFEMMDGLEILFATLEEDGSFFLLVREEDAVTSDSGLYAMAPRTIDPTVEDFKFIPTAISNVKTVISGFDSEEDREGLRQLVQRLAGIVSPGIPLTDMFPDGIFIIL